jgi:hypothetical protein
LTPTILSNPDALVSGEDDEEVYTVSYGQLLTYLVGEVSEVGLDDVALGSRIELQAAERKSRSSSIKRNAWPNKKTKVYCFQMNGMFKNSRGLKDLDNHLYIADSIREHVLDFVAISEMGKRNYSTSFLKRLSCG